MDLQCTDSPGATALLDRDFVEQFDRVISVPLAVRDRSDATASRIVSFESALSVRADDRLLAAPQMCVSELAEPMGLRLVGPLRFEWWIDGGLRLLGSSSS